MTPARKLYYHSLSHYALLSLSKTNKCRKDIEYTAIGPKAEKPSDKHALGIAPVALPVADAAHVCLG